MLKINGRAFFRPKNNLSLNLCFYLRYCKKIQACFSGCWLRAEIYSDLIQQYLRQEYPEERFEPPKKHFVFGDLRANSNSTDPRMNGIVYWWFHVALIIRLDDGKLYVLDPALNADAVEKEKWYSLMTVTTEANISGFVTCNTDTYHYFDSCFNPSKNSDEETQCELQGFLSS